MSSRSLKTLVFLFVAASVSLYLIEGTIYDFVKTILSHLANPQISISEGLILALTTLYVALCGLILPTPAEIPLFFVAKVHLAKLILASAVGKSIGSILLFVCCSTGLKIGKYDAVKMRMSLEGRPVGRFLKDKNVGITYTLCQALPFAPMRSATVAYSTVSPLTSKSILIVAVGSFIGTISRMLIISGLAKAGILILTQVGNDWPGTGA